MSTVLKTQDLTKIYKNKTVNDHITMEIQKGDIYGFVGKNGAGKTTFIRNVLGLIKSDEGTIELFESNELIAQRKKIGSLIEGPAVYKDLSARDNLEAYRRLLNVSTERMEAVIELVGLKRHQDKLAKHLSLGLKQRLGIAIALLDEPEFLILDEPLNGLDPMGIVEMRDLLLKLQEKEQVTMLISSHVLGELAKVSNRFGILKEGKLVEEITKEDLMNLCADEAAMEDYFLEKMGGK